MKIEERGVVLALDLIDEERACCVVDACQERLAALKIGNIWLYRYGLDVVRRLKRRFDLPVICDFKLMDIPDIAAEIIGAGAAAGMDGAMIWGLAGEETAYRCVASFPEQMIFIVTGYTHSADIISERTGEELAELARELNAFGVQAPASYPRRVAEARRIVGDELKIISCGVGYQGTPYGEAVRAGADFEIVGRAIYDAPDPAAEAAKAADAIEGR